MSETTASLTSTPEEMRERFKKSLETNGQSVTTPGIAKPATEPHNELMDTITRPEFDAKLELIEARADARMSRFEERIDAAIGEMRRDRSELKTAVSSLKTTTIVTAIGAALTIVFGVAAFNATVLSNMVASFESGKNTVTAITQATEQIRQVQEQMKQMQDRIGTVSSGLNNGGSIPSRQNDRN